jgi:flavin reductase (DIM6/NTAB) family NADH-FMN oxidoreductase RutF
VAGLNGVPVLPQFAACFECSTEHRYEGGDHVIIVGRVLRFEDRQLEPLIFYRSNYHGKGNRRD